AGWILSRLVGCNPSTRAGRASGRRPCVLGSRHRTRTPWCAVAPLRSAGSRPRARRDGHNTTSSTAHVRISWLRATIPQRTPGERGGAARRREGVAQPLALSEPLLRSAGLPDLKRVGRLDATTAVAAQLEISWWCPSAAECRREQSRPWQRVAAQS